MSGIKSSKLVAEGTLTPSQIKAIYEQIRSIREQLSTLEDIFKPKPRLPREPYDTEQGTGTKTPVVVPRRPR
jgi:hypothetical protein